jgi:hypothetical protein
MTVSYFIKVSFIVSWTSAKARKVGLSDLACLSEVSNIYYPPIFPGPHFTSPHVIHRIPPLAHEEEASRFISALINKS